MECQPYGHFKHDCKTVNSPLWISGLNIKFLKHEIHSNNKSELIISVRLLLKKPKCRMRMRDRRSCPLASLRACVSVIGKSLLIWLLFPLRFSLCSALYVKRPQTSGAFNFMFVYLRLFLIGIKV